MFGNIGWTEFLVILAIALIFFGPRRLPGIAQALGKSLREFQKALNEVKAEIVEAGREADTRSEIERALPRPADTTTGPPSGQASEPEATREGAVTMTPRVASETPAGAAEARPRAAPDAAGGAKEAAESTKAGDGSPGADADSQDQDSAEN